MRIVDLMLNFTQKCNSFCKYCRIWEIEHPKTLTLECLEKAFKSNTLKDLEHIYLTGGEPLIDDYIIDICSIIKKTHPLMPFTLATNCVRPYEYLKRLRAIKDLGMGRLEVQLSVMGLEKTHDSLRGIEGNFKSLEIMAWLLREHRFNFRFNFTPLEDNLDQAKEIEAMAKHFKTDVNISNFRKDERFGVKHERTLELKFNCPGLVTHLAIHPNGDVSACDDYIKEVVVGNLYNQDLDKMDFKKVRVYIEEGKCQPCSIACWENCKL